MNSELLQPVSPPSCRDAMYRDKPDRYFARARVDIIDELPHDPSAAILEIGCGTGDTGAAARSRGKCGWYAGIELCESAATQAQTKMSEIVIGDVEAVELPWKDATFDALILSEVLEHLVDPWSVLRRIRPLMKSGARVFASSPNIAHHQTIRMLLAGRWDCEDIGLMDCTHLRWFTPRSFREMFESCGYRVESVEPLVSLGLKARLLDTLTRGRLRHLLHRQTMLRAVCE